MGRRGFIFSLDAFVAFTLVMVAIAFLVFAIGTPKPFYPSLEQTQKLAYDTLTVLSTSSDTPGGQTYLEQILADQSNRVYYYKTAGGSDSTSVFPIIPKGYGYSLEVYDFNTGNWGVRYDAGSDPNSDRYGKSFTKVRASATSFASLYSILPAPGESPFCYATCRGYVSPSQQSSSPCNATPCDRPISNFYPGLNSISIVRFVVYA